jgi:predicted secreted protein
LRDAGEITATTHLIPGDATLDTLMDDYNSNDVGTWRLLMPDGSDALQGQGFVSGLDHSFPIDDAATFDLTVQCSGEWKWVTVS